MNEFYKQYIVLEYPSTTPMIKRFKMEDVGNWSFIYENEKNSIVYPFYKVSFGYYNNWKLNGRPGILSSRHDSHGFRKEDKVIIIPVRRHYRMLGPFEVGPPRLLPPTKQQLKDELSSLFRTYPMALIPYTRRSIRRICYIILHPIFVYKCWMKNQKEIAAMETAYKNIINLAKEIHNDQWSDSLLAELSRSS